MASLILLRPLGIPLRIHWTLFVFLPFLIAQVSRYLGDALPGQHGLAVFLGGVVCALGLFTSVTLHELGHALAGRWRGYRTRDILLLPIGGIARMEALPGNPLDEILIALAGPLVSLILGAGALVAGLVVYGAVLPLAGVVLITLGGINLMLALFNLIPCFPMDGGRVLRALASRRMGILRATRLAMQIGNGVAILMASYALYKGLPMLLFIAIFIFFAARSEYRAVVQREQLRRMAPAWAGFWPVQPLPDEQVEAIEVGPPPFR